MFRFAIRDLLWVTALVAVGTGWWLEYENRGPENVKLRAENERLIRERDTAKWQLETGVALLAKRGVKMSVREFSVSVRGDFSGNYTSGRAKIAAREHPEVIPIDLKWPE